MRKNALRKEFHREIRKSFQRFLSIFLISALGVSFFAGLRSCKSDMLLSADAFYDETNMMDFRILSALGLTEADLEAVSGAAGVKAAEGVYTGEAMVHLPEAGLAVRFYPLTKEINTYRVLSGRLPENMGECAVDERFQQASGYQVGDKILVESGTEEDIGEILAETGLTITGIVSTGRYMSASRGNGTIGNGKLTGYLVLDPENIKPDYYTEIYAVLDGTKELDSYSGSYEKRLEEGKEKLEEIGASRAGERLLEVQEEAYAKISALRKELEEKERELKEGGQLLEDAKRDISGAYETIAAAKEELEAKTKEARAAIEAYEQQAEEAEQLFRAAQEGLEQQEAPVLAAREEYNDYVRQLEAISQGPNDIRTILAMKGIYEEEILAAEARIAEAREELNRQEAELSAMREALEQKRAELEESVAGAEEEIAGSEKELREKEAEFLKAKQEYDDSWQESQEKIADAHAELAEREKEAAAMGLPEWYILGRDTIESYAAFEQDADRMDAIGKVFPAIFFLVAALVSLTTMTRMVDEERTQIGTLKALGYSPASIAGKYIKYALYATLSGSIIGFLAGGKLFPYIVITTYKLVYASLPEVITPIQWYYAAAATLLAVLCTALATLASCLHELKEQPSGLMRPVVPKAGKRIFLERITFVWKKLNFTRKASLRNMFRYKKRFFMTVVGIGGCMALMLVGFGLKDSICVMSKIQYGELWLSDATVSLDTTLGQQEWERLAARLESDGRITEYSLLRAAAVDIESEEAAKSVNLIVLPDTAAFEDFFVFRGRNSKERYFMQEDGIILSEKLANALGVGAGDSIFIKVDETARHEAKISAVTENYIYHYAFMTASMYETIFGDGPVYNECILKFAAANISEEEAVASDLLADFEIVASVSVTSTFQQQIDDMLQSLNIITYVLIICAGLLAFIVLYNLSNININERKRELATLKVLGFYNNEVSSYIYRENVLLTCLGILLGIIFGKLLHGFVIVTCEVDMVMFGRVIEPISYLYSSFLTVLFAVLIGIMMHFKLKKIDMIESLKSIE